MRARRRTGGLVGLLLVAMLALSGCRWDIYDLPLPGGADVGEDPISITVEFADVLDLVPDSAVKVADVSVGRVEEIDLIEGYAAVELLVRRDAKLPSNSVATIRQTSLLGEKFVDLAAPAKPSGTLLVDGDTIALAQTGRNPEVEEVLGALSLILNGGGVAQLQTISREVNQALAGREDAARGVLAQAANFAEQLDRNSGQIVAAIEALDRLAISARKQQDSIDATLVELPDALRSIDSQREAFVTMLTSLEDLGQVGARVVNASKDEVIRTVKYLEPTLAQLAASGDSLVKSIDTVFTYPFVDEVVGRDPQVARNIHMGDYVNLSLDLVIDAASPIENLTNPVPSPINPTVVVTNLLSCLTSGSLTSKACKDLMAAGTTLVNIQTECKKPKYRNTALCSLLNQVPGLPNLTGIVPSQLPSILGPLVPTPLGDLLGGLLPGLLKAAPEGADPATVSPVAGRFSYAELSQLYDPTLVRLMLPGLAAEGGAR